MGEWESIYQRITYLRDRGIKMKEIAASIQWAPSVLSALYSNVLPTYFAALQRGKDDEEALDYAVSQVNNVSKKKLLSSCGELKKLLFDLEPEQEIITTDPFSEILGDCVERSVVESDNICGTYFSYSISSSGNCLKVEPYLIVVSERSDRVCVGHINTEGTLHWGTAVFGNHQHAYLFFNECEPPRLALFTIYLQLPMYEHPDFLKGLYLSLDGNRNPVARRILFVKQSDSCDRASFQALKGELVEVGNLTEKQQLYYDYTCKDGDFIKTCCVPSPRKNEEDLITEKKILECCK